MRFSRLIEAKYIEPYKVFVSFKDGTQANIDLQDCLWGEMYEPLKDVGLFSALKCDPEIHTIVWPNGADIAPEFLYERAKGASH